MTETGERFLLAALELFSVYGFNSVSVRDISAAVGTRESAMYRHFKNKAALLQAIIDTAADKLNSFRHGLKPNPSSVAETLTTVFCEVFSLYAEDEFMLRFRKLMTISRYESEEAAARYNEMFQEKPLKYYEKVFEEIIRVKGSEGYDAKLMALELYAPLHFQLHRYDNPSAAEKESAKALLRAHVYAFFKKYEFLGGRP